MRRSNRSRGPGLKPADEVNRKLRHRCCAPEDWALLAGLEHELPEMERRGMHPWRIVDLCAFRVLERIQAGELSLLEGRRDAT